VNYEEAGKEVGEEERGGKGEVARKKALRIG
jgi:hypothetical protein